MLSKEMKTKLVKSIGKAIQLLVNPVELKVSRRNKKLVPDSETAFIIWNLPAMKTCPGSTPHCREKCYARKAEKCYPSCMPARIRNYKESKKKSFVFDMAFTILKIAKGTKKSHIIVRIHESGDFYSKEYVEKWLAIMAICAVDPRIKFIAYTKSFDFFDGLTLPGNFSLRASVWDDTPQRDLETIKRNGWNIYTAVDKFEKGDAFTRCHCKSCAKCAKCWHEFKDIRCEIH